MYDTANPSMHAMVRLRIKTPQMPGFDKTKYTNFCDPATTTIYSARQQVLQTQADLFSCQTYFQNIEL